MVHEKRPCCGKGKLKRDETPPPFGDRTGSVHPGDLYLPVIA